jgi:predicted outer membrane lipoprotein
MTMDNISQAAILFFYFVGMIGVFLICAGIVNGVIWLCEKQESRQRAKLCEMPARLRSYR